MKKDANSTDPFAGMKKTMNAEISAFKKFLRQQAMDFAPELRSQAKECISTEGKFIRPIMVFASAGRHSMSQNSVRRAAIAELTHLSTLIHDDVIDCASLRRGTPTVHKKFGTRFAILLGDAIFAHTMNLSLQEGNSELSSKCAKCVRDICEGEIRQTLAGKDSAVTRKRYFEIVRGKTGVLFELSCYMGASLNKDAKWTLAAASAGADLGVAYQIFDDICEWTKSEADVGKTLGTDVINGRQTFPIVLLFEKLPRAKSKELARSLAEGSADSAKILSEIKRLNILQACADEFHARISRAKKSVSPFGERAARLLMFCDAMESLAGEE